MQAIESMEQYASLKASAKSRCASLSSNCFLTNGGMKNILEKQGLFFEEYDQGLVFYTDEGLYLRVFYYLDDAKPLPDLSQAKPVVIEEPDVNGKRQEYLDAFYAKLENAGWQRVARNIQVYSTLKDREQEVRAQYAEALERLKAQGLELKGSSERSVERVITLWKDNLHVTDLPKEHLDFIHDPEQHVVCVTNSDDYVCGVNWWRVQGGNCEIRHTVTDAAYLKRGIGYTMQLAAMTYALDEGCRGVFTYIDDRNYRSINMFKKAGIVENGRTTVQYSLTRGE